MMRVTVGFQRMPAEQLEGLTMRIETNDYPTALMRMMGFVDGLTRIPATSIRFELLDPSASEGQTNVDGLV